MMYQPLLSNCHSLSPMRPWGGGKLPAGGSPAKVTTKRRYDKVRKVNRKMENQEKGKREVEKW